MHVHVCFCGVECVWHPPLPLQQQQYRATPPPSKPIDRTRWVQFKENEQWKIGNGLRQLRCGILKIDQGES